MGELIDLSRRRFLKASTAIAAAAAVPAIAISSSPAIAVDQALELEASTAAAELEISPIAGRVISAIVLDGGRQVLELADRLSAAGLWVKPGQVLELVRRGGLLRLELDGLAVASFVDDLAGKPIRAYVDELELEPGGRRYLRQAGELAGGEALKL